MQAAYESQADPAAASLVWHTRPDGNVELPGPAAVMDDADDPREDDVDMLQVCVRVCVAGFHTMQGATLHGVCIACADDSVCVHTARSRSLRLMCCCYCCYYCCCRLMMRRWTTT
jgi:hypothetical protein